MPDQDENAEDSKAIVGQVGTASRIRIAQLGNALQGLLIGDIKCAHWSIVKCMVRSNGRSDVLDYWGQQGDCISLHLCLLAQGFDAVAWT